MNKINIVIVLQYCSRDILKLEAIKPTHGFLHSWYLLLVNIQLACSTSCI